MSIFNELLPKILEIGKISARNFEDELKDAFEQLDKFEEEFLNGRSNAREKAQKDKTLMTTLQSINEDDDETKSLDSDKRNKNDKRSSMNRNSRRSKKRSKDEVEDMLSPEQDKRQKRNASVKAQSIISKQEREILKDLNENGVAFVSSIKLVNVNLTQKMRREESTDKSKGHRRKEEDKENAIPLLPVQIKQEKISLPPEPMEEESLPVNVEVKQEVNKDDIVMPPPVAPVPKPRKAVAKEKSEESSEDETGSKQRTIRTKKGTDTMPPPPDPRKAVAKEKSEESSEDEMGSKQRGTRTKKGTDTMPPPPVPSARSTRASSRASSRATKLAEPEEVPPEPRPKRTRAKKKVSDAAVETEKEASQENCVGSPAENSRPKRTRRGKEKAPEKELEKPEEPQKSQEAQTISPKEERVSKPESHSPVLQKDLKPIKNSKKLPVPIKKTTKNNEKLLSSVESVETVETDVVDSKVLDETKVLEKMNSTVTISNDMDKTMVLPNGIYTHAPVTPKTVCNATVVLERCEIPDKASDATVIIEKGVKARNMTDDNSLLTDDNSDQEHTPPKPIPQQQPSSAVKEKVQQFEELAARTTRTKTRAMAKVDDQDNHTPPDKMIKPVLSAETLSKMNNMIFNGKPPVQISSSASKPRVPSAKPQLPSTTSKLNSIQRHKDAADEMKNDKESARRKKEAMLEAKRELQKKKREDKMAAAAAAREAAERERRLAMEAAARERVEKQAHADLGKLERLREVERKKQELARKVAETEERRRAEEQARQQRLAEEQKRADAARRKQLEEAEAMKKEAAIMAKEIEKRQKEYMEKQKIKHRMENDKTHTPLKYPGTPGFAHHPQDPVYMQDGFQFLNSDEDEDSPQRPVPDWSTSKARKLTLVVQSCIAQAHIDALFSVRVHSPDLRDIFPAIERARLKRTSSAVWRTPPRLPPVTE